MSESSNQSAVQKAGRNLAVLSWQAALIAAGYKIRYLPRPKWIKETMKKLPEIKITWHRIELTFASRSFPTRPAHLV